MQRAFAIAREELVLVVCVTLFFLDVFAAGIDSFENDAQPEVCASVFDGLWWAVVTTVGYRGVFPSPRAGASAPS